MIELISDCLVLGSSLWVDFSYRFNSISYNDLYVQGVVLVSHMHLEVVSFSSRDSNFEENKFSKYSLQSWISLQSL